MRRLATLLFCGLLLLVGCGERTDTPDVPPDTGEAGAGRVNLLGELTYRQRIALPDDAVATVALVDLGGTADANRTNTIAAVSLSHFQQVPITFSLTFPRDAIDPAHGYDLRAKILDSGGQVLWRSPEPNRIDPLNEDQKQVITMQQAAEHGNAQTLSFACEGLEFNVTVTPSTATLELDNRIVELPSVRSASGAKYSDGDSVFWSKGQSSALLELDGRTYKNCSARS